MAPRIFRFYQRHRIVNVNLNIVGAGLLAVAIAKYPVHLLSLWIGPEYKFINSVVAAVVDGFVDIALYFVLHWVANHWGPIQRERNANAKRNDDGELIEKSASFWREASLVQFERLTLTPVFYLFAIGGMWGLQHAGMRASWAFVLSFSAGLVVTRVMHTWWALRTGRFEPLPIFNGKAKAAKAKDNSDAA
ncbi:MAG: hypothetical protein KDA31_03260 [Phycisphaerales bacterium]|nr:hypothetical protein [Phycisphaerales bacterium]MCB9837179.1 hypothetical protein [Phycisphaera sp.]